MSLLSYTELLGLMARGVIKGADLEQVNSASIDITLGDTVMRETFRGFPGEFVSLRDRTPLTVVKQDLNEGPLVLKPGEFILAQSRETFHLPTDISAEYKLKSSMARIGINHCLAGWCDAGWNGSVLTLELMNVTQYHNIVLNKGDRIGQMIFFQHTRVPDDYSYAKRGRYNNDVTVEGVKK